MRLYSVSKTVELALEAIPEKVHYSNQQHRLRADSYFSVKTQYRMRAEETRVRVSEERRTNARGLATTMI